MKYYFFYLSIIIIVTAAKLFPQSDSQDSGDPLTPEWSAYDVKFYNINLKIDPDKQTIGGHVVIAAKAVKDIKEFVLDLDDRFRITRIILNSFDEINFKHENGKLKIELPDEIVSGTIFEVKIYYGGKPRVAQTPPWDDGFTWSKTKSGEHWI